MQANTNRKIRTAYDLPEPSSDLELTSVGKGTPGGELLRRYWHPVAVAAEVGDRPVPVRILGEDLVLFRTGEGSFGLVHQRCAHRGSSLRYGKVEARGIRCCYHGWLFSPRGECLDQPCEADGGRNKDRILQPWYPVEERYGLVFAYMGPLDRMPGLPRYSALEHIEPGGRLHADGNSIGSGGPKIMPCNWFQTHENVMDAYHVPILHGNFSSAQFPDPMSIMPEADWEMTDYGVLETKVRRLPDGRTLTRILEVIMPTVRVVGDPTLQRMGRVDNVAWTVPIDDTHTRIFTAFYFGPDSPGLTRLKMYVDKTKYWHEMTEEEHQAYPGDYEAQVSQGAITFHSEEHLVPTDRGVGMLRRFYRQQVRKVAEGGDPVLAGAGAQPLVELRAGNFMS